MTRSADRPFDWVAGMAFGSAAVVVIASLAALAVSLLAVALMLL